MKLPKGVLFAGVLLGRFAGILDLVDGDRDAQGRICLFPDLGVRPIVTLVCAVDHRIEGVIDFPAVNDVFGLLVNFIADGLGVIARRGDKKVQRLHAGIAGAFGHNIEQFSVWLGMQLIKNHAVGVETMLVADIS